MRFAQKRRDIQVVSEAVNRFSPNLRQLIPTRSPILPRLDLQVQQIEASASLSRSLLTHSYANGKYCSIPSFAQQVRSGKKHIFQNGESVN